MNAKIVEIDGFTKQLEKTERKKMGMNAKIVEIDGFTKQLEKTERGQYQ